MKHTCTLYRTYHQLTSLDCHRTTLSACSSLSVLGLDIPRFWAVPHIEDHQLKKHWSFTTKLKQLFYLFVFFKGVKYFELCKDLREAKSSSLTEKPRLACARTGFNGGFKAFMEENSRPVEHKQLSWKKSAEKVDRRVRVG